MASIWSSPQPEANSGVRSTGGFHPGTTEDPANAVKPGPGQCQRLDKLARPGATLLLFVPLAAMHSQGAAAHNNGALVSGAVVEDGPKAVWPGSVAGVGAAVQGIAHLVQRGGVVQGGQVARVAALGQRLQ